MNMVSRKLSLREENDYVMYIVLFSRFGILRNIDSKWLRPSVSGSLCTRHMFYMPYSIPCCISFVSWKIGFHFHGGVFRRGRIVSEPHKRINLYVLYLCAETLTQNLVTAVERFASDHIVVNAAIVLRAGKDRVRGV